MLGYWLLGFMVCYTALLVALGKIGRKKIKNDDGFFSGSGSFGILKIIACVSASAGAPVFISVLELSYTGGISACWFGGATMIMLALIGFAHYIAESAPAAALVFLGFWAAALSFAGPCLFSGGTSLGRDFIRSINRKASAEQLIRYGRYATVILTMMMIVYGFMRAEQAAWWNIFGYNLRNSAIFAPTIAAMVWPVASRRATVFTMTTGAAGGFAWYYLGGFSPVALYQGIHPMWVGMSLGILTLVISSLIEQRRKITVDLSDKNWRFGFLCLALALSGVILLLVRTDVFRVLGLLGNLIFLITMGIFAGSIIFFHFKKEYASSVKPTETKAVHDACMGN